MNLTKKGYQMIVRGKEKDHVMKSGGLTQMFISRLTRVFYATMWDPHFLWKLRELRHQEPPHHTMTSKLPCSGQRAHSRLRDEKKKIRKRTYQNLLLQQIFIKMLMYLIKLYRGHYDRSIQWKWLHYLGYDNEVEKSRTTYPNPLLFSRAQHHCFFYL